MPKLTTNTLIIGDENLERVEEIAHTPEEALVLSYPEIKLNNLKLILEDRRDKVAEYLKTKTNSPGWAPKQVIFNIGAHDREMQPSSIHSHLGAIKPLILNQFRASKIYFFPINPVDSKAEAFNKTVSDFCEKQEDWVFIDFEEIPFKFETDPTDPDHWSRDFAQRVADFLLTLSDSEFFG